MAWNPQQTTSGTNWQGNPPVATLKQLNSTIGIISTVSNVNYRYTSTSISTLQSQLDGLILSTGGTTANWASFPALTNVNINSKNITGAATVTATSFSGPLTGNVTGDLTGNSAGTHTGPVSGNVTGNVTGNITGNVVGNISNANLTVRGQYSITETADVGSAVSNYASYGTVNISGKGGLGGIVNITADVATPLNPAVTVSQLTMEAKGNYGLITPGTPVGYIPRGGLVSITARQGLTPTPPAEVTSALFANGEIDLTAYSYGIVPGLIKLSAGANAIYAGAFSPITGIFGNNYIAATVANTMTAGLPPSGIPTLVGTNYFYATLGVGGSASQIVGNRFQGGVGIDFLQPYPNGDLIIQSNLNGTDTVVISGVKSLAMSNGGNITGVGNLNVTTINSAAYPPIGNQTFSNISTSFISTGRLLVSSINDSIKFTNQPIGNNIEGINDLFAQTAVFNTSLASYGSFTAGSCILGSTRVTGLFRITDGGGGNVATITTAGAITGTSLTISGTTSTNALVVTGTASTNALVVTNAAGVGSLSVTGAASANSLTVTGAAGVGSLTASGAAGVNSLTVTNAAGVGSLSVTGTTTAAAVNATSISNSGITRSDSVSTNNLSTAMLFVSSVNGVDINAFGGSTTIPSFLSTNIISTGTAFIGTISSLTISTGAAFISSVNGVDINSFGGSTTIPDFLSTNIISSGTASISSIFTNNLSTAVANISSLSIYGNLVFLTAAKGYDISKTLTSTVTNYDKVSSLTQDIFGYKMNLTTTGEPQSFDMGSFFAVTEDNPTLWSKKQLTYSGELAPGQAPTINIVPGSFATSAYFDVKNIATNGAILNIWNPFVSGGLLLQMIPGTYYRFTYNGTAWTYAANPTNIGATYFNTFAIYQGWEQTTISTGNIINLEAGAVNIPGFTAMDTTNINYLTAGGATFSTIVSPLVSSSAMFTSSINGTNINTILNPTTLSSLSTTSISTAQIKTSSINANTLTFTSPLANPTGSWDINREFQSTITVGSYNNVSSITANILNYNLSATIPNIATFFIGAVYTIQYNDAQWASQFLVANLYLGGTIILLNASATNYFDCQNQSSGNELLVTNYQSGGPVTLFTVPAGNLTIYRVTATVSAGVTTWSYAVSPGVYSPTTVTNNLTISADLQNTYISSINRVQFNTGDVYFNSPIYAPNAYINDFVINNLNVSTISTVNMNAGNIKALGISTNALSTNSITTNSLTTNSFTTTGPLTVPSISTNSISTSLIFTSSIIASTRVVTPSISTLNSLNGFNARLINNPGNVLVYTQTVNLGNGAGSVDINTDPFVPGVYTCSAVCRGNVGRTLEATLYYNSRTSLFCENANGFDNYNVCWWHAYNPGFVRFTSRTDGPGDTFDIYIYMISGQYKVLGDDPPFPQASTITSTIAEVNTGTPTPIVIGLSSLIGSTITIQAKDNISLLANILPPSYISSGNITIAGSASVEIIGQQAVVGGLQDVNIEAVNHDVNIVAASTISLTAPVITAGTAAIGTPSYYGNNFAYFGNNTLPANGSDYALLQEFNGTTFLNCSSGRLLRFRNNNIDVMTMSNNGLYMSQQINMGNNNINSIFQLNFSNSANIDGTYANQLNFNASNSYFLGNLRFYGSNRTLDIADNQIYACSYLYGSTGGFLTINAGVGMVIENNQGARQALNSDGSFEFRTTGANKTVYINSDALTFNGSSNNRINNVSSINGNATLAINANTINVGGALFAPQVTGLSSINGSPFTGGSSWVGTATSDLDMANYSITNLSSITSALTTMTLSNTSNIDINAPNINVGGAVNANCNAISNVGAFSRYMISTELPQPVIQYAYISTTGAASGTITITLPQRYTSVNSYIPFAVVQNDVTTTFYVSTITRATFEIGWDGFTGFGDIIFSWNTLGT